MGKFNIFKKLNQKTRIFWQELTSLCPWYKPKLIYVALGDSLVEGVGASHPKHSFVSKIGQYLKKDYSVKLHNLGVAGSTSFDVLEKQLPKVMALNPNLITISVGANDIKNHRNPQKFASNLEKIINHITITGAKVVICTLPDISKAPKIPKILRWYVGKKTRDFNKVIEKIAQNYNLILCDFFTPSQLFANKEELARYLAADSFHLSDEGYKLWSVFLYDKLRHLQFR